jgi:creatinine amidohydrolase
MSATILQDLIGKEVEEAFESKNAWAILPLGSTEFHGPRGPYGTDHYNAWQIGERVSAATGALLLPSLPYGYSPNHKDFTGTIHLEYDTLKRVLFDIVESLHRGGILNILILLGHWGNFEVALETKEAFETGDPDHQIEVVRLFDDSALEMEGLEAVFDGKHDGGHGGAREVAAALYARPHLDPPPPASVAAEYGPLEHRNYTELGWQGLPEEASAERGGKTVEIVADSVVRHLRGLAG